MELTSEFFESVKLLIRQPAKGHRYGSESLALADFCRVREGSRVAELGSGCGVISLVIAARDHPRNVAVVEIQDSLHRIAIGNMEENDLGGIVGCINADWRKFAKENPQSFDAVVANPPFYRCGSGRQSDNAERAAARHEMNGTIGDLVAAAREILVPGGGLFLAFPSIRRDELIALAGSKGFAVLKIISGDEGKKLGPNFLAHFEKTK
ncbi:MAG: methyltransferase [Pseudomonadota bacterium]